MNIRTITSLDVTQLLPLYSQLTNTSQPSQIFIDTFFDALKSPFHNIFVYEIDNQIIGAATLLVELKLTHGGSRVGHIEEVVVDTRYRRKGIGKMLVQHIIAEAKRLGCYKVILDCGNDVKNFYESCGLKGKGCCMGVYFE
ncbi:Glucosamine 6-phosphate N-acetyltransferase [Spironucleus salmonicida]|uniref:Glucosamine 6-phosphate N-acetyltransferase n=1 Tax=Spironucleus salmonicida TaxID=348837 RepID=V6LRQ1_9EUKA|nr:Glucosamine 6-phosphate N-acetyltransferase [Spironucleus salmonicida]|eukprot:EST47337.1 Glucosamine 6-phosphate N-acetyltransferase [Spironucleus salmonicida]